MLLSIVDRSISSFNAAMMLGEEPPFEELAETIDSLEKIWKFADGLNLSTSSSFLLHRQTLGVARSLVTLGDVKSKKYGSEWVERIASYVRTFESEDLVKVICALRSAPERESDEGVARMDVEVVSPEIDYFVEQNESNKKARSR